MKENQISEKYFYAFKDATSFRMRVDTHLSLDDLPPAFEKVVANKWAIGCLKCNNIITIPVCKNCGSNFYKFGLNKDNFIGLFCVDCNIGFTGIQCNRCGSKNPISEKTLLKNESLKESGCFIVTAALGDLNSYEVQFLSGFRDHFLASNELGKKFIKLYYRYSPNLAKIISKNRTLKYLVRNLIVRPAIYLIKLFTIVQSK